MYEYLEIFMNNLQSFLDEIEFIDQEYIDEAVTELRHLEMV